MRLSLVSLETTKETSFWYQTVCEMCDLKKENIKLRKKYTDGPRVKKMKD